MLAIDKNTLSSSSVFDEQSALITNSFSPIARPSQYTNEIQIDAENFQHPPAIYLVNYVIAQQPIPETSLRKKCRKLATVISAIIACTSGIPYIQPSRDALEKHETLGWIVAITTIFSFGAGSAWAWLNIMRELDPHAPEESSIIKRNVRVIRMLFANLLGSLATLPSAYAVYKFNNNFIFPVIAFTTGVATNIYALYMLYDGKIIRKSTQIFRRWKGNNEADDTIPVLIDNLGQLLSRGPILLLNTPPAERSLVLSSLYYQNPCEPQKYFELFLKEIIKLNISYHTSLQSESWGQGWPRFLFKCISTIFPISFSMVNAALAYESSKLIYDNIFFGIIYILVTVVPYMSIEFIAAIKTFEAIFDQIFNYVTGQRTNSFSKIFYPKTNLTTLLISILLGLVPSVNRIYITLNTIENKGKIPLTVLGALGGIIFQTFSLMDLKNQIILKYAESKKDHEEEKLAYFFSSIEKFIKLYEKTDLTTQKELIANIQDPELIALINQTRISDSFAKNKSDSSSGKAKFKFFQSIHNNDATHSNYTQNMCSIF